MIWVRRKPREIEATTESYKRWLRAQRPPFEWFLRQPVAAQEMLAVLGDDHARGICLDIGYAVADPDAAEAGIAAADDPDAEEILLRKMTDAVVESMGRASATNNQPAFAPSSAPRTPKLSMGGVTQRAEDREQGAQRGKDAGRRLFGRAPDVEGDAP